MSNNAECKLLSRKDASQYLMDRGVKRAPSTLAKLGCIGGGPPFKHIGRAPMYPTDELDAWILSITSPLIKSTSGRKKKESVTIRPTNPAPNCHLGAAAEVNNEKGETEVNPAPQECATAISPAEPLDCPDADTDDDFWGAPAPTVGGHRSKFGRITLETKPSRGSKAQPEIKKSGSYIVEKYRHGTKS